MTFNRKTTRKNPALGLIVAALLAQACSAASEFKAISRRSSDSSSPTSAAPVAEPEVLADKGSESERPTESGEGVPGYLTDPGLILVSLDGGKATIAGSIGAVASDVGAVADVVVSILQVPRDKLDTVLASAAVNVTLSGQIKGTTKPATDGSFTVEVDVDNLDPIVISTIGGASTPEVAINKAAIKQTTAFKDLAASLPTHTFAACTAGSPTCNGEIKFDVTDTSTKAAVEPTVKIWSKAPLCGLKTSTPTACGDPPADVARVDYICQDGSTGTALPESSAACGTAASMQTRASNLCANHCEAPLATAATTAKAISLPAGSYFYKLELASYGAKTATVKLPSGEQHVEAIEMTRK